MAFRVRPMERGLVHDILEELIEGNHGILVMGRRDSRKKGSFRLSSKAYKLLHSAHDAMLCLVN